MTSCFGCNALINNKCDLDIPILIKKAEGRRTINPTQPCPRPTTDIKLEEIKLSYQGEAV